MKKGFFATPDDVLRLALETLGKACGDNIEDLDPETQAALDRAFAQSERGEARPWEEVRADLDVGILQAERGEFAAFTAKDIMAEGRAVLAKRSQTGTG